MVPYEKCKKVECLELPYFDPGLTTFECCVIIGEAGNIDLDVFGLIQQRDPTHELCTQFDHTDRFKRVKTWHRS